MRRKVVAGLVAMSLTMFCGPAVAQTSGSYVLNLVVPVDCRLQHLPDGAGGMSGQAFMLGQISEYCNDPGGYEIVVNYTPGTLEGTVLSIGEEQVTLNGSGQAVVSRAPGPRIRARALSAIPGQNGFDTDRLDFQIQPV